MAAAQMRYWALVALPVWGGLAYVSVFSMLVGFVFSYRGLALDGIAGSGSSSCSSPSSGWRSQACSSASLSPRR